MAFGKKIGIFLGVVAVIMMCMSTIALADAMPQTKNVEPQELYQQFVEKLSINLGLPQDKVTKALEKTKQQMLENAVHQGKITQQQMEEIAKHKDFCFPWLQQGNHHRGPSLDLVAKALGITVTQLQKDLDSGKHLRDIVQEQGLTTEQFRQKIIKAKKDALAQEVQEGKLTQEQANKILEKLEQKSAGKTN